MTDNDGKGRSPMNLLPASPTTSDNAAAAKQKKVEQKYIEHERGLELQQKEHKSVRGITARDDFEN